MLEYGNLGILGLKALPGKVAQTFLSAMGLDDCKSAERIT